MQIYIGNIIANITEDDLRKAFGAYGKVTFVKLVKDKINGNNKEFAFVEMPIKAEAENAILHFDHTVFSGNIILVNKARAGQTDRRKSGRRGGRRNYDNPARLPGEY